MRIYGKLSDTFESILNDLRSSEDWTFREEKEMGLCPFSHRIVDVDHWSSTAGTAFLKINTEKKKIEIITAWSGYKYTIEEKDRETFFFFEGAFKGFKRQVLLPALNIQSIYKIECSTGKMELLNENEEDAPISLLNFYQKNIRPFIEKDWGIPQFLKRDLFNRISDSLTSSNPQVQRFLNERNAGEVSFLLFPNKIKDKTELHIEFEGLLLKEQVDEIKNKNTTIFVEDFTEMYK